MRLKGIIYILLLALVLTACGKAEDVKKEDVKQEDSLADSESKDDGETEEASQSTEEISDNLTQNKEDSSQNLTDNSSQSAGQNSSQNASQKKEESEQKTANSSQKPSTNTAQNSSQKPNNNTTQNATQNSTSQNTERKPIDHVWEEIEGERVPYKYGILQYDMVRNDYMLYNDGTRELLDTITYTYYDQANYSATFMDLKKEAEANTAKYKQDAIYMLQLVNEIRAEAGVAPLTLNFALCHAANMMAIDMDYEFEFPYVRKWREALSIYGLTQDGSMFDWQTNSSPEEVVEFWKGYPSQYREMINPENTELGAGFSSMYLYKRSKMWTMIIR